MVLTPKKHMTDQEMMWWVMCITANRFRFGFGRQANRTLKDLNLPAPQKTPSWLHTANPDAYQGIRSPASVHPVGMLAVSNWKAFTLQGLFIIRKGQRLTKANMLPGTMPYIGASDTSNGVTAHIGQDPIHGGGTISVTYDGSIAEAFYQPDPFGASDAVNVFYPKGFTPTSATALFICTIIRMEKYHFNFGRKWHLDRMRETVIRLPATTAGTPDWDFMDKYIKTLPYSSQLQ